MPKEQVGVGMGLFSMIDFIGQGLAVGEYGIVVEQRASVSWNPLHSDSESALFSYIYLTLAAMHAGILCCCCLRMRAVRLGIMAEHAQPAGRS